MCVYLIIRKGSVTHTDSVVAKVNIDIEDFEDYCTNCQNSASNAGFLPRISRPLLIEITITCVDEVKSLIRILHPY